MCRNAHISITHKFTEKFMLYFYVYTGTNYEADMKLNVFRWLNRRTSCYSIVSAVTYIMVKNDRFGLHFCFPPGDAPVTIALNVT